MGKMPIIVEIENHGDDYLENTTALLESRGFKYDRSFKPITIDQGKTVLICGEVDEKDVVGLEIVRGVVRIMQIDDLNRRRDP